jgi:ssDNA-binding Zn-finger/Zn-ribbon topoisomerase 1
MKWNFEPTEKTDQECPHCGLFYSDRGIKAHRENCPLKGEDYWVRRPEAADVDEGGTPPESGGDPTEDESDDDVAPDPSSHTSPSEGDAPTPKTDGGNPALDAPDPDPVVTDGGDASDDPKCPECGGNRYFDASEYTDYQYGCPDCSDEDSWVVFDG